MTTYPYRGRGQGHITLVMLLVWNLQYRIICRQFNGAISSDLENTSAIQEVDRQMELLYQYSAK